MLALPSWVPNWSSIIIRKPLGGVTTNVSASKIAIYYDASGWQSWTSETQVKPIPLVPIHPDPEILTEHYPKVVDKTLKFRGVICDEIDKLLRIPPVRSIRVDLVPLFEGMRMLETSMAKNPYPTNEDMTTVAWKTLVANIDYYSNQSPPEEWRESYIAAPEVLDRFPNSFAFAINGSGDPWDKAWGDMKTFLDGRPNSQKSEDFTNYVEVSHPDSATYLQRLYDLQEYQRHVGFFAATKIMATGRTLCLTKKGLIGWCPDSAEAGDQICIVAQAAVPFVVRPYDAETYTFVGDSYIHGAMNGEYLLHDDMPIEVNMLRGNNGEEVVFPHIHARVISFR